MYAVLIFGGVSGLVLSLAEVIVYTIFKQNKKPILWCAFGSILCIIAGFVFLLNSNPEETSVVWMILSLIVPFVILGIFIYFGVKAYKYRPMSDEQMAKAQQRADIKAAKKAEREQELAKIEERKQANRERILKEKEEKSSNSVERLASEKEKHGAERNKNNASKERKRIKFSPAIIVVVFLLVTAIAMSMAGSKNENEKIQMGDVKIGEEIDFTVTELEEYLFWKTINPTLESIGINKISEAAGKQIGEDLWNIDICANGKNVVISLSGNDDIGWNLRNVKDRSNSNFYYLNDSDKFTSNGLLKENIYSFETGEVVEAVDENAIKAHYAELELQREQENQAREQKVRDDASALFHEIRAAYKNNELSADDTYKGNRYTIVGEFDGANEDGIFPSLLDEINITVKIMDGNTVCYVFCSFDKEEWRDRLAELNKGDEMIIEGECYSWGSWNDCELKN